MFPVLMFGGKATSPGSASFTTPGTYSFTVPAFSTISFDLKAPGGGGGGITTSDGSPGTNTTITELSMQANTGAGGTKGTVTFSGGGKDGGGGTSATNGTNGADGTASGPSGSTATTGGGALGGSGGRSTDNFTYSASGGDGGKGGRLQITYNAGDAGAPAENAVLTIVVGTGGARGVTEPIGGTIIQPTAGADGSVTITWT